MKVDVTSKKGLKTNLKITIDKKIVEEKNKIRLEELSKTVNLKGFRPGKVPVNVLKSQFGKAVFGEVLEKILQETSTQAIKEKNIKVSSQPKLNLKSHEEGKDIIYELEVDELPSIKLQPLDSIKFTDYEISITGEEVTKRINEIAKNQNNFKDKGNEAAENGDLVVFDYDASIDNKKFEGGQGKNTQIVLGKELFIKGFDKQLVGVKKNQEKDVLAVLPENYPKKEFANKKANFKCKILNVKKPEVTKVDDQFAKNLGTKDLSDLKSLINKQIQNQYKSALENLSKETILQQIEKLHNIDLPDNLVQQELALITQSLNKDDIEKNKKENEKTAKKRIKLGLILNELGEKNNLKVQESELTNEIQKQVQSMPDQQQQVFEYYKKNPSAAASLRGAIYEDKIINLIKQKSKKIKKTVSSKEAEEIIKKNSKIKEPTEEKNKTKVSNKAKKAGKTTKSKKKIRKK
jgi:trigger factor